MADLNEVHVLAVETPEGYKLTVIDKRAWNRLSGTLRLHNIVVGMTRYWVKAQTWVEDDRLARQVDDFDAELHSVPF